jgi:hypothetical protein
MLEGNVIIYYLFKFHVRDLCRDELLVKGARNSALRVAMRDIACSDLILDVYFDLAVAMKSLSASLALVRVLYMVLLVPKRLRHARQ